MFDLKNKSVCNLVPRASFKEDNGGPGNEVGVFVFVFFAKTLIETRQI